MPEAMRELMSQEVPCRDSECEGIAEPEQDGDHLYYHCPVCEYDFGYERVPQPALTSDAGGTCAIGVPESIRAAASRGMERAMEGLDSTVTLRRSEESVPVSLSRKK